MNVFLANYVSKKQNLIGEIVRKSYNVLNKSNLGCQINEIIDKSCNFPSGKKKKGGVHIDSSEKVDRENPSSEFLKVRKEKKDEEVVKRFGKS